MFEARVAIGERVAVWRAPGVEPEPRLRVLLPGQGESAREQASTAVFVPSVQQTARKTTKTTPKTGRGPAGRRDSRGNGRRRVVLPGDPTAADTAFARWRGHPGTARTETDRALRLGLIDGVTEVGAAMLDLGCWRTRIAALPPGPDLVTALTQRPDALAPAPVSDPDQALATAWAARSADVADRVVTGWANAVLESVTARARVLSWLQAEQYTDLAMLSRNYPGLAEMLPTEVGFAMRTSDTIAGNAISTARTMTLRLPATLEALRAGLIDAGHATGLASATSTTTAQVAAAVEADLLPQATAKGSTITAEQLRRRAVRRVIAHDPDGAADRHRKARTGRTMTRWAEQDGMAGLKVLAPAEQIAAIWEAVTGLADATKTPWDPRSLGARRVDCLSGVCLDLLTGMTPTPDITHPTPATPAASGSGSDRPAPTSTTGAEPVPPQPGTAQPRPTTTPPDADPTNQHPNNAAAGSADTDTGNADDTAMGTAADTGNADDAGNADDIATGTAADTGNADDIATGTAADTGNADDIATGTAADAGNADDAGNASDTAATPTTAAAHDANSTVTADTPTAAAARNANNTVTADDDDDHPQPSGRRRDLTARHGRRPHIQVLVPYQVLLGSNDPCELAGHGAITAEQARAIITDGVLQRILYDPASGTVLDYGRTRYEPPETLKQFITARDRTCRTPGCLQPAERCDIDHIQPFRPGKPTGGRTCHICLDAKCRHHHRAKDGGGFLNTRDPDGTTHWTTPLGRKYTMPPPQIIDPLETQPADRGTDNAGDTADLDDQFPPELRRTTNFFLQTKTNPPGSLPNSAKAPGIEPEPENSTETMDSADAASFEEEPPF